MPKGIQLDGLTLAVTSVRRSMKFYSELMGFKLEIDAAPDFALVRIGGRGTLGLLPLKYAVDRRIKRVTPAMRDGFHLEFGTDDLDATYEKLKARGVVFDSPPADRSWGERSAYALDPDGYVIELAQGERAHPVRPRKRP